MKFLSEKQVCLALFATCLVLNLWFSFRGWDRSLREYNESRQVQTALAARELAKTGWQLDYSYPLFGPPWSAPFEFPAYQQTAAKVHRISGYPLEQSGRAVSLACLYLSLPALWLLQAAWPVPVSRRLLLPALVLVSPCYLYYSRSFMIESMAFACAVWFLVAWTRAVTGGRWYWIAAAILLSGLAGLIKSTTLAVHLIAAGVLAVGAWWQRRPLDRSELVRWLARAIVVVLPSLVLTYLWTRHADAVKAANPLAEIFTSTRLRDFIYGTPGEIFTGEFWRLMSYQAIFSTLHPVNAGLLLVGVAAFRSSRLPAIALLLCFLAGPLVFPTLYSRHDYYFFANGIFALAALGVVWSALLDWKPLPVAARWSLVIVSLALQFHAYRVNYLPVQTFPQRSMPELARVLNAVTGPTDVVLTFGQDWNPLLAYFGERRMAMVVGAAEGETGRVDEVLRRLGVDAVGAMVVTGHSREKPIRIPELVRRLDLHWKPVLTSEDSLVFLRRDLAGDSRQRLAGIELKEYTIADDAPEAEKSPRQRFTDLVTRDSRIAQLFQPPPAFLLHPFLFSVFNYEGRVALDAHVPTDICIEVPAGATQATLEFGIKDSAYTPGTETDGVEFRADLEPLTGQRQIVFDVFLDPMRNPAHRGRQTAVFPLPAGAAGRLWFRTLPGPLNSSVSDHAYWMRIEVK